MITEKTIVTSLDKLEDKGEKKPYLTFVKGPRLGELVPISQNETFVGRLPECTLWIQDNGISRKHFKLDLIANKVKLTDLGSTNGTYLNGKRVDSVYLQDGDKIRISLETILEFNFLDDAQSLTDKRRYEMGVLDPVTNIFNKRYFLDRLKEEFAYARRKKRPLSLIMFDIDHFKTFNDQHGHLVGDLVLERVCGEIAPIIRTDDLFARYGGEEFVILMREANVEQAADLAERVRALVEKNKVTHDQKELSVTISCGVSALDNHQKTELDLIDSADQFLYQSKNDGRNRVSKP